MFTPNLESALQAGSTNFIETTGYYKGKFTEVKLKDVNNSKTQFINFTFESDSGEICYLSMCITDRNGKAVAFTHNMISALMCIWRIKDDGYNEFDKKFTNFENKRIMLALQREEVPESKYGYQMHILNFFDPTTEKTFLELHNNKPAETSKRKLTDKKSRQLKWEPGADDIDNDIANKMPWDD